jgi:hypothetical protein
MAGQISPLHGEVAHTVDVGFGDFCVYSSAQISDDGAVKRKFEDAERMIIFM